MPTVEKLNVQLEANASSLKGETKEAIKVLQQLQDKYKEVSDTLSKAFKEKGSSDYISSLTDQRNELMRLINELKAGTIDANNSAISKALGNLDTSGIEKVKEEIKEVNNDLKETHDVQKKINLSWDTSGLKRVQTAIKKIATSIVGITSVFALIRKSMSVYLSQNDALREKLNGIYYALGSLFAPILEWIVNLFAKIVLYVNAFLKGLGLAGIQFKSISNGAKKTQKSMEKVKTIISGFDELNIFNKQSTDQANEAAAALQDPFAGVKVNQEWIEKLTKLGEKLRPIFEWLRETLKSIFDWVTEHIGLVIAALVAIKGIGLIAKAIQLWDKLKLIFNLIKEIVAANGLGAILKMVGGIGLAIGGAILAVSQFIDMWKNGWNIIGEILKDLGIALAAVGAVLLGAPAAVAAVVAGIAAVLSTLAIVIHEHWDEISTWLSEKWNAIKEDAKLKWDALCETIKTITSELSKSLQSLWEAMTTWLSDCWNIIKENASTIWTAISNVVQDITKKLHEALRNLWEGIKTTASNIWNGIKSLLNGIMEGIKNFFVNAWETIKNTVININNTIATSVQNIWNGLVNVIKGAINGILGFINGMIRGVTNGINAVINLLNRFRVNIPNWVPGFGGKSFGFNLQTLSAPQIPLLARGGVIKSPTMAMMGEYAGASTNPEIAAPQSLFMDMLDSNNAKLVSSFAQMTQQVINAINNVDMKVNIGDDTIARSAARGNNSYKSMTGRSLITI